MGYAVEMNFDAETGDRIRALWQRLADAGLSRTLLDNNATPHISLAVFDETDLDLVRLVMADFAHRVTPISVRLAAVGTFPPDVKGDEGAVFLAPTVSAHLLSHHDRFHRMLYALNLRADDYYLPGNWVPHCTVALDAPPDKIAEIVTLCRQSDVFHDAQLVDVSLVEFRPVKELYRYPFEE
jgi:2'-5' RNA ligase